MRKILFCLFFIPVLCFSQYGILDTNFGDNGILIHPIEIPSADSNKIKVDANGNIYVLGTYFEFEEEIGEQGADVPKVFLMKFFPNGSLDDSFGGNGYVRFEIPNGFTWGSDLEIINDEEILVVGNFEVWSEVPAELSKVFLVSFDLNGSINTDFGSNGMVMDSLNAFRFSRKLKCKENVCYILENSSIGYGFYIEKRFFDGSLDTSYGEEGIASYLDGVFENGAESFVLNDQNELFVIHYLNQINRNYIKKIDPNGNLVNEVYYNYSEMLTNAITLFNDKIYLSGNSNGNFGVKVYNQDLSIYEDFGENGMIEKDLGFEENVGNELIIGENGRLTQIGYVSDGSNYQFGLAGYLPNGDTDNSFGEDGVTITDVTFSNYDTPEEALLVAPDKVLVLKRGGLGLVQYAIYDGLSVEDVSDDSTIILAPNPTSNSFVINGIKTNENTVEIFDMTGKLVREFKQIQNNQTINLEAIPKGIYFVKITSGKIVETKKLMVK